MQDNELKRLSRSELLELLISQSKKLERIQAELDEANAKLRDREILLEESGCIAEAALRLNDIFGAAQKAADQYVENVMRKADRYLENLQPEGRIQSKEEKKERLIDEIIQEIKQE